MRLSFAFGAAVVATGLAFGPAAAQDAEEVVAELCNPVMETDGDAVLDSDGELVVHAGTEPCPVVETPVLSPEPTTIALSADVLFDFDEATLRPEAQAELDSIIPTLQRGSASIEVAGHTDSIGTEAYNQDLSLRRAQSVSAYLAANGINEARLIERGFGESRPVAPNQTANGQDNPEGRQQNRRVEISTIIEEEPTS